MRLPDGWTGTQGRDNATAKNATDDLIVSRYPLAGGKALETRTYLQAGHGDRAYAQDGQLVTLIHGAWRSPVWGTDGYVLAATPARCNLRAGTNCQGEARLPDGRWLRLYGGSIKADPKWHPGENAYLQVIDGTTVVAKVELDHVARDSSGLPVGGRYEPEGVQMTDLDGEPWVLVGFAVGQLGNTTMRVYGRPLSLVLKD